MKARISRKFFCLLLAVVMVCTLLPTAALAAGPSGSIESAGITHDNGVLKNAVSVDLKNVNFESSVQVQLYSGETLLTTATLQGVNPGSYGFLTCCIATETADEYWSLTPWTPKDNIVPNKAVLFVDGHEQDTKTFTLDADEWAALPGTVQPPVVEDTYIINATSGSNGTVAPYGKTEVNEGDNLTISITPNQGYAVDTITVDGIHYVNNGHGMLGVWDKFTFASVNANHDLRATFDKDCNGNGIPDKYEDHDWPDWPDRPEWPDDPDDGDDDDRDDASDPTYAVYYYPGYGSGARDLDKRYEEDMEVEVLAFEDVDLTGREGYTFIGWSTQANADSVTFLPEDIFDMPDHDVHLYAQWLRDEIGPEDTGVANWLNTTDHIAYLTGYPGGTFGPNNSMTRAEVAQMFYALLNNKNVTITASFPDVPADAWYATAVNTLASLGMVSGDADGNFRPNDPITRAEFCVIALAFAYEPESYSCSFTDVSVNDWFYTYVAQAASYGWIGGYADGSFGPNDLITRAQVTTIVNNMLGREADRGYVNTHTDTLVQFYDLTSIHWAYYDIMEAVNEHEYTRTYGTEDWVE